jgi:hypothetical protein
MTSIPGPDGHLRLNESEKNLVEALAGALGAVCATWTFYPLDTVKTRLQARKSHPERNSTAATAASESKLSSRARGIVCRCHSADSLVFSAWPHTQAAVAGDNTHSDSLLSVGRHLVRRDRLVDGVQCQKAHLADLICNDPPPARE